MRKQIQTNCTKYEVADLGLSREEAFVKRVLGDNYWIDEYDNSMDYLNHATLATNSETIDERISSEGLRSLWSLR